MRDYASFKQHCFQTPVSALANLTPLPFSETLTPKAGCHVFMGKCSWTASHVLLGTAQIPWLCTEILPNALLDLALSIFLGQGSRERTIEADRVCIDFRQRESKRDIVSLNRKTAHCSQQRVWLNHCSKGLAVCPWKIEV